MKLLTAFVAATVGACLLVHAAPVTTGDGLLLERSNDMNTLMVPVANVLVRRTEESRSDGDDVTLGSSIVNQAHDLSAQVPQDGEHSHRLAARSPSGISSKMIGLAETATDMRTPLLKSSEPKDSGFLSRLGALFTGRGKQGLTEDASSSSSISGIGDGTIPLRTGQRELVEAEVRGRKSVHDAKEALELARAQVVEKKKFHEDAKADVDDLRWELRTARGSATKDEIREELVFAKHQRTSDKKALKDARAARQQKAQELEKAKAGAERKSAPDAHPIIL